MLPISWRLSKRESKPVHLGGSGGDVPELGDILGTKENTRLVPQELRDGMGGLGTVRVIGLSATQENVRVNQNAHQRSRPSYIASRLMA